MPSWGRRKSPLHWDKGQCFPQTLVFYWQRTSDTSFPFSHRLDITNLKSKSHYLLSFYVSYYHSPHDSSCLTLESWQSSECFLTFSVLSIISKISRFFFPLFPALPTVLKTLASLYVLAIIFSFHFYMLSSEVSGEFHVLRFKITTPMMTSSTD